MRKMRKAFNKFLLSKQQSMTKWNDFLSLQSSLNNTNSDNSNKQQQQQIMIKPQAIATAVSRNLDDNSIISVDSGTNTIFAARFIEH